MCYLYIQFNLSVSPASFTLTVFLMMWKQLNKKEIYIKKKQMYSYKKRGFNVRHLVYGFCDYVPAEVLTRNINSKLLLENML